MDCIRCGNPSDHPLVHRKDTDTIFGGLCSRCYGTLVTGRRNPKRCGEEECEGYATYGTFEQKPMFNPGESEPSRYINQLETPLLCEDCFEEHTEDEGNGDSALDHYGAS